MKLLAVLAALTVLLLAGCSSGDPVTPKQDEQGRYEVHMTSSNRFTPMEAQVPVGATVIFLNDGGVHDVTAHDDSWESPRNLKSGQSYEHQFATAGEYTYHCEVHASQGMKGTIHVG